VQGGERPVGSRAERRKEIIELHRKGIAANIIANRMGSTVGEVELIISLADRKE
jgi:DNA-binding NarL/FixJ family response regulator